MVEGSSTVFAGGKPVVRIGDANSLLATVATGSPNVSAGG